MNIAAIMIAMRIIFFIPVPPKERIVERIVRTASVCLGTITTGQRLQLRARHDPRNDKLFGRNHLAIAL